MAKVQSMIPRLIIRTFAFLHTIVPDVQPNLKEFAEAYAEACAKAFFEACACVLKLASRSLRAEAFAEVCAEV